MQLEADIRSVQAESVAVLPVDHQMILHETKQDRTLQNVLQFLRSNWPSSTSNADLLQFFKRKDSFFEIEECVMFLDRIVIPATLREAVLRQLHVGHPGMQRMKSIARSYVYWSNIDCDIEDFVRKCSSCAIAAKAPVKSTLPSWPIPTESWTRLHLDYAGPVRSKFYLVIIDACSKWPEIFATNKTTASTTVAKVRECISRFGCPHSIVTDNGTQFTSELFAKMCQEYGIEHVRTPAFHPQSNGQAERFVNTLKRALLKMGEKNPDEVLLTFLETYRYTPNASLPQNKSPAEALLGRKICTKLDLIKRSRPQPTLVNENQNKQYNQKHGCSSRTIKCLL
ncbi:uncharacterized protein K02A2.6-like [Uranotaenia lowii]|uniref:uncharacterized protein K02A2.6-like n=1 Tax=Uranotaenia lowii TaxID=190385 RepID=UPI002479331C|nr:uncharacterized protein K02A2.6-like [Uranotaenia lowii]